MSILNKMKKKDDIQGETDVLGGGGVRSTDVYDFVITSAYLIESAGGAHGLSLEVKDTSGSDYRETIYFTNRNGENTYKDKKTGEERYLPGFLLIDSICNVTLGKDLFDLADEVEEKVVGVYNYEAKKEVPTKVDMLVPLIGEEVKLAIMHTRENKSEKDQASGRYEPINEPREVNNIAKAFHAGTGKTVVELSDEENEEVDGVYIVSWLEKNKGKMRDRFKEVERGSSKSSGGGSASSSTSTAPKKSLFKPKS